MTIRNPIEWAVDRFKVAGTAVQATSRDALHSVEDLQDPIPAVRRINNADVWDAVARGRDDFGANRTDIIFICIIYPVVGVIFARLAFGYEMLPLLFPLASGFALVGPFAAIGLYEMSRRREQGVEVGWTDALGVFRSPAFGAIIMLGLVLMAISLLWMATAAVIYRITFGSESPASIGAFLHDVFLTGHGWALIILGVGVGFVFAVVALSISVVSFPLLLDRNVGLETAVWTSVRAVAANPRPMALWGLIVAVGLVLGSIPLLLGLVIVMPVLGHATWHLYRKVVPR